MTDDLMKYDKMVENALRGVVRKALEHARDEGLPGDHHFYLTFRTTAPGVSMPDYLQDQYPEEMTIVLQHQFWDLTIERLVVRGVRLLCREPPFDMPTACRSSNHQDLGHEHRATRGYRHTTTVS